MNSMTDHEFTVLVKVMRETQKAYFAERTAELLEQAKAFERLVDKAIADRLDNQARLFE